MSDRFSEYVEALKIDKLNLDEEVTRQPELVRRVGEQLALAISRHDEAKDALANTQAMIDAQVRRASAKKATEAEVKAQVAINARVVEAQKLARKRHLIVNKWKAMEKSVTARGHALRELVTLYVNDYYAAEGVVKARNKTRDIDAAHVRKHDRQRRRNLPPYALEAYERSKRFED